MNSSVRLRQIIVFLTFVGSLYSKTSLAQERMFDLLVGTWYDKTTQTNVQVSKSGNVSSSFSKGLIGRVKESSKGNSNFAFYAEDKECYYRVTWLGEDGRRSNWKLVFGEPKEVCPPGGDYELEADLDKLLQKKKEETLARESAEKKALEASQAAAKAAELAKAQAQLEIEAAARAQKRIADAAAKRANGPSELSEIDLVYFEKTEDQGLVADALSSAGVVYSTRAPETGGSSNTITCTPDVEMRSVKKLASILIDAGIEIKNISPSIYPDKSKRLTIERFAGSDYIKPLTKYQVENLEECRRRSKFITVYNQCDTDLRIYIRYNRASDGKWEMQFGGKIGSNSKNVIKDSDNHYIATENSVWYLYAWRNKADGTLAEWTANGENTFAVGPKGTLKSFIRRTGNSVALTCSD